MKLTSSLAFSWATGSALLGRLAPSISPSYSLVRFLPSSTVTGSFMGHLAILKLLSYMKPEPAVQLNTTPDEPLHGDASTPGSPPKPERHSPSADLMLARLSLCMEFIGYTLFWTLPPSPAFFVGITIFVSLGAGFGPAVQSVALSLFTVRPDGRDTGKLFGAISVVQAIRYEMLMDANYCIRIHTSFCAVHRSWVHQSLVSPTSTQWLYSQELYSLFRLPW